MTSEIQILYLQVNSSCEQTMNEKGKKEAAVHSIDIRDKAPSSISWSRFYLKCHQKPSSSSSSSSDNPSISAINFSIKFPYWWMRNVQWHAEIPKCEAKKIPLQHKLIISINFLSLVARLAKICLDPLPRRASM